MNSCKKYEKYGALSLYNELSEKEETALNQHLEKCPQCRNQLQHLRATLGFMGQRERTEPEPAFWDGFWGDIQVKLVQEKGAVVNKRPFLQNIKQWLVAAGTRRPGMQIGTALVMLCIGIFIGKFYLSQNGQENNPVLVATAESGIPVALQQQTSTYLEKTNLLLLGITNFDTKNEDPFILDLKNNKALTNDLINQAAALKHDLSEANATRLLALISELELILMQLANLEEENDIPGIEFVQSAIEGRSILLKINLNNYAQTKRMSLVQN